MYLAAAHKRATPRINRATTLSGGYVLHLDAAHEADAPVLFTGIDGLSKIVLASVKMPSESSEHIAPFLNTLRENYGEPAACVHDMGKGICKAVADELPGVPDYICHYHFLGDIGDDLLEHCYGSLRKRLRKHSASTRLSSLAREAKKELGGNSDESSRMAKAIGNALKPENPELAEPALIYSLSLWILQGKQCTDGYGFPFDRPLLEFSERILQMKERLSEIKDSAGQPRLDGKENLEELFAELGQNAVKDMAESQVEHSYILPGFAALAKLKKLPEKIICFLSSIAKEEDSNRIL